jgi:hypothetical protein
MEQNPYEAPHTEPIPRLSMRRFAANCLILVAIPLAISLFMVTAEVFLSRTVPGPDHAINHAVSTLIVAGSAVIGAIGGTLLFGIGMLLRNWSDPRSTR